MAISKITLNGEVQMDVTQDTVTANNLLSGETATGADGVGVTGNIATKTSSNMTVSGATVTAPAGYYATAASKSVASGGVTQNAPTINTSTGVVTATSTVTAGYVSADTKSNTLSLSTQAATTVTPTTSSQTAVAAGRYTTGAVTVAAIPSEYVIPTGTKTITDNGTGIDVASYASVDVNVSGGGGGGSASDDVIFIDYDGTIVDSYSAADFAQLSALPSNPSHSGLIAQGWNWSLSDAKTYVAKYGQLVIGQMYVTDDGKTRIYIHLEEGRTSPMLGCCPNGTVVVDWGDGSATDTLTGTSAYVVKWTPTHNYANAGDYIIALTVTGSFGFSGTVANNGGSYILRYDNTDASTQNIAYLGSIRSVEIGSGVTMIGGYAFRNCMAMSSISIPQEVTNLQGYGFMDCRSLRSVTIPNGPTIFGYNTFYQCYAISSLSVPKSIRFIQDNVFYHCHSLSRILVPDGVTSIGSGVFQYCFILVRLFIPEGVTSINQRAFASCFSLQKMTIPNGVTTIADSMFDYCRCLTGITVPDGVTSIGSYAFEGCYSLAKIRFLPTTPPTVANANAWANLPTDCKIYVPTGTLSAYTSAANYPDPATYTYIEE